VFANNALMTLKGIFKGVLSYHRQQYVYLLPTTIIQYCYRQFPEICYHNIVLLPKNFGHEMNVGNIRKYMSGTCNSMCQGYNPIEIEWAMQWPVYLENIVARIVHLDHFLVI
jgi:hypothetical protein